MNDRTTGRRMRRAALVAALAAATVVGATGSPPAQAGVLPSPLRLNEIQVVGSHNSYHLAASPKETAVRRAVIGAGDDALQYFHAPLDEQFQEQRVRQIELDVFRDDEGGLYSDPLIREAAGEGAYDAAMDEPGTKVLHVQDVDYRSTCLSLVACLETVEDWSDAHPDHLPIAILLELKDDELDLGDFDFTVPEKWTPDAMDDLDDEIRSVVADEDMITPDDIRGEHDTLEDAVLDTGWPTIEDSRGKVMFMMDNEGGYRTDYLSGHPTLEDRVLFTNSTPGHDDAAFVKVNDSRGNVAHIQDLVADGYMVRTRSDGETVEARANDTTARDAAFESGAQWVSTDYPIADYARRLGTSFVVAIPGGTIARCNPVNGPDGCVSVDIEPYPERVESAYVSRLFQTFFGRAPGNVDQWFWARKIEMGASRAKVARELARSAEGNRGPFVRAVSQDYLGRDMDAAARTYWAGRLAGGWPLDNVRIATLASNEIYNRAGGTDADWVDELYDLVLEREADTAGRDYFVARLASGTTRSVIARLILGSLESRRTRAAGIGATLLERTPTASEVSTWADVLRLMRDEREVAVAVVATNEFHD